ncbi:hypothetical protein QR680_003488 [Steinernema hermaphroditum]|uniref:Hexosyltransferase n=1 Tax=Steinernema hermaphroditum TaxID=289476 RepID=A0AA39HKK9_9BILA|nr:hypothetical protein QR680_003488 [Steinernema hermaphroditum]
MCVRLPSPPSIRPTTSQPDRRVSLRKNSSSSLVEDDVVRINYSKGYYNLQMKTYGFWVYHRDYCPQAKYLLKVDSDVLVNLKGFEELCRSQGNTSMISGYSYDAWVPVNSDPSSKFYIPNFVYSHGYYPPYA